MQTKYEVLESYLIIKVPKELDHHQADILRSEVELLIHIHHARNLVFDFAETEFMDSSGIGLIMGRYKLISRNGGQAFMVNLKPTVRKIFQMSGIFKILTESKDIDSVLQKIKTEV